MSTLDKRILTWMIFFEQIFREITSIQTPGGVWSQELKLKGIDGRAPPGVESAA